MTLLSGTVWFCPVEKDMGLIFDLSSWSLTASIGSVFSAKPDFVHESPDMDRLHIGTPCGPSTEQTRQGLVRVKFYCHPYST